MRTFKPREHINDVTDVVSYCFIEALMDWDTTYGKGFWITSVISFTVSWLYAIATYGFFLGVGLGWIPSLVIASVAGLVWPFIAIAFVLFIVLVCGIR